MIATLSPCFTVSSATRARVMDLTRTNSDAVTRPSALTARNGPAVDLDALAEAAGATGLGPLGVLPALGAGGAELDADALGRRRDLLAAGRSRGGLGVRKRPLRVTPSFGLTRFSLASKEPAAPLAVGIMAVAVITEAGGARALPSVSASCGNASSSILAFVAYGVSCRARPRSRTARSITTRFAPAAGSVPAASGSPAHVLLEGRD